MLVVPLTLLKVGVVIKNASYKWLEGHFSVPGLQLLNQDWVLGTKTWFYMKDLILVCRYYSEISTRKRKTKYGRNRTAKKMVICGFCFLTFQTGAWQMKTWDNWDYLGISPRICFSALYSSSSSIWGGFHGAGDCAGEASSCRPPGDLRGSKNAPSKWKCQPARVMKSKQTVMLTQRKPF